MKKFRNIQIINSSLKLTLSDKITKNYLIDLNLKNNELLFSIAERNNKSNFLSFNYVKQEGEHNVDLEVQNFNFSFLKLMNNFDSLTLEDLNLSGSSKLSLNEDFKFNELFFNFKLDGSIGYLTFNGYRNLDFIDTKISGEKYKNNLDIIMFYSYLDSKIKSVLRLDLIEKVNSKVFFEIDKLKVTNLLNIWPNNLKPSVYSWMKENTEGDITNFLLSLNFFSEKKYISFNNPSGKFKFDNTNIRYMESMPPIKQINGEAKIFKDRINFSIFSGKSKNLLIENGNVDLFDLDTATEKAQVVLEINSENTDVVNYLSYSPINKKSYEKLKKINGQTKVELDLKFPLLLDLPAERIQYKSSVEIQNGSLSKIFNELDLNNLGLNIYIDNSSVTYNGEGEIFKSRAKFSGKQLTKEGKLVEEITGPAPEAAFAKVISLTAEPVAVSKTNSFPPVSKIEVPILGDVKVLFVKVCVPVRVTSFTDDIGTS